MVQGQVKQIKTVMIMAAGTGGHVFPALAVAEHLRAQGIEIHWLATRTGMEHRLVGSKNIPLHPIDIQGLRGNGLKRLITAPFKIMAATLAAMRLMRQLNIDAVIGFGGYVAGPGGLAARLLGLPLVIHEQNAIAGFTNTQLARLSALVLQAFPNTFTESQKVKTTGNPVRADIASLPEPQVRYAERGNLPLNILVVGGSLGAQALNERIPAALAGLDIPLNIMHQCGQQQLQATQQRYIDLASSQLNVQVMPFVEDMANAYARADLIICRAGALTVTEIATAGVAAVFVPLPSAVDDHQTANARYLVDCGAALLCPQASLTPQSLQAALQPIMKRATLQAMAEKARQQAHPQATRQVSEFLLSLSH
ncbi:undecaprenyldiphospho-muramoylpentapeptide beta-N-acetylglucosaminyltransferase [Alkanindiges illinoisensis]|uniref:undecaprenyldiphospho-muramoylpentapeptide beta-N-acetylglucosaminyltransferase n=1 Tax=Alkanindiges illinoisensis TaxID=197183 RepID=UPI000479C34E|nr:undecaprenyldiphospho-muramoylpentapeptide beta-N-acetylglucosaminyltransferase [Alkanindiges illinoisensis]